MTPDAIRAPTTLNIIRECLSPHNAIARESFWIVYSKWSPCLMMCSYLQPFVTKLHKPPYQRGVKEERKNFFYNTYDIF
jgi:hypothetical protein